MAPGLGHTAHQGASEIHVEQAPPLSLQTQSSDLRGFLERREGSTLRAWLLHFDRNHEQKISLTEFTRGMRKLGYPGDVSAVFNTLDVDQSGEISLEEVDAFAATLWRNFRAWCVASFESPQDMLMKMSEVTDATDTVDKSCFTEGARKLGWEDGCEDVLYHSLDDEDHGCIAAVNIEWLETEKKKQKRKEQARARAQSERARRTAERKAIANVQKDFKKFLKKKYGHFVRAWRRALSGDGSMLLQKTDLFKACARMGWPGDVRLLWRALDPDDSGAISIEELDVKSAETIALFHRFVDQHFGTTSVAFRAFDRSNTKKLRQGEFLSALKSYGFTEPTKSLFQALDFEGNGYIVEEDLFFLDRWRPPAFLVAAPNPQAAEEVKALLLANFRSYLRAWRQCLDVDSSNRVYWNEFEAACRKLKYTGDVAGAWRALDEDLSGFITLHEIDAVVGDQLAGFKQWVEEEFGGAKSALKVFDGDGSHQVSFREFRRGCRTYGYHQDVHGLFHALDVETSGHISTNEVAFLDEWTAGDPDTPPTPATEPKTGRSGPEDDSLVQPPLPPGLTFYETDGPGPARYNVPTTIGAGPLAPTIHFSGAYTFRRRPPRQLLPGVAKDASNTPSPCTYDDERSRVAAFPSKPVCVFGTEPRHATEAKVR